MLSSVDLFVPAAKVNVSELGRLQRMATNLSSEFSESAIDTAVSSFWAMSSNEVMYTHGIYYVAL